MKLASRYTRVFLWHLCGVIRRRFARARALMLLIQRKQLNNSRGRKVVRGGIIGGGNLLSILSPEMTGGRQRCAR